MMFRPSQKNYGGGGLTYGIPLKKAIGTAGNYRRLPAFMAWSLMQASKASLGIQWVEILSQSGSVEIKHLWRDHTDLEADNWGRFTVAIHLVDSRDYLAYLSSRRS